MPYAVPRAGAAYGSQGAATPNTSVCVDLSDKLAPCASPPKPTMPSGR